MTRKKTIDKILNTVIGVPIASATAVLQTAMDEHEQVLNSKHKVKELKKRIKANYKLTKENLNM